MENTASQDKNRFYSWPLGLLLAALAVFLIGAHYVKAYSDPYLWLTLGNDFIHGQSIGHWAPLYPIFLGGCLTLIGRACIFWVNTPFLLILTGLVYLLSTQIEMAVRRSAENGMDRPRLAGITAATLFAVINRWHFLELQNPYREAVAFCLLLAGVSSLLAFFTQRGLWRVAVAAVLIGLAAGFRETCGLVLIPIGLVFIYKWVRERDTRWLVGFMTFLALLALGLLPFLIQNYLKTGSLWIPSYAAAKWAWMFSHKPGIPLDIPIPGMSIHYFVPIGGKLLMFLLGGYTWWGIGLFAVGLVAAAWRRNAMVFVLLLPFILLNLLFYSFWHTVSWRFCFVFDLFVIPIMAIGAAAVIYSCVSFFVRRRPRGAALALRGITWVLTVLAAGILIRDSTPNKDRLKVWQIGQLREFILPKLESPAAFTGPGHVAQMLCWHLNIPYADLVTTLPAGVGPKAGTDAMLKHAGATNMAMVSTYNVYCYGEDQDPLLKQWFNIEQGPSLQDAPVPIETYSRPLTERLYRIVLWRGEEVSQFVPVTNSDRNFLLLVDGLRLWDYPGRTYCRLTAGGRVLTEALSNGPSFFVADRSWIRNGGLDIHVSSDAPLPSSFSIEAFSQTSELTLPFCFRTNGWLYPLFSRGFSMTYPWQQDGFLLFHEGDMVLPKFCERDCEMDAEFRIRGRTPLHGSNENGTLIVESPADKINVPIPDEDEESTLTVALGAGTGSLEWTPIHWITSTNQGSIEVLEARLFTRPFKPVPSLSVDIGTEGDDAYLMTGFYRSEHHGRGITVRWTAARCRMNLPVQKPDRALTFTVRSFNLRPGDASPGTRFAVNGWNVPESAIRETKFDHGFLEQQFKVPGDKLNDQGSQFLEIDNNPWIPSRSYPTRDSRALGLMMDSVDVRPE